MNSYRSFFVTYRSHILSSILPSSGFLYGGMTTSFSGSKHGWSPRISGCILDQSSPGYTVVCPL